MYLKSLELSGFKSFAKKASLSFHTPITAIVGPNGSGKSNVAEAFRFVLGEQSMKSMRSRRTEDLIWNGSRTAPRSNRASAKLVFDNTPHDSPLGPRRLFDIDYDEVSLERTIYRDASSEYSLNGSPVRLKDIIEMLANAHIGASGHHIISQGEADRILSVNPRDRKEMIEDALGLKIYQYKKEESLRKLEKTRENLEKAESIRREIKPHLAFLEKQVAKVEKAKELAGELVRACQEYFAREEAYLSREQAAISEATKPLHEELKTLSTRLTEARETLAKTEGKDAASEELLSLEKQLDAVRASERGLSEEIGRIEGEEQALARQVRRLEEQSAQESHKTIPFSAVAAFGSEAEKVLEEVLKAADETARVGVVERLRSLIREFITRVKGDSSVLEAEIAELRTAGKELAAKRENILEKRRMSQTEEAALINRHKKLQQELEADVHRSREAERAVFALSNQEQEIRIRLQEFEGRTKALSLEKEEFERDRLEAGVLVGTEAVRYAEVLKSITTDVENEPRAKQEERKKTIERMKIRLEDAGLAGGEDVLKEYQEVSERDGFLSREIEDLTASAESLTALIVELEETLAREFAEGLVKINEQFSEFFAVMFGGGTAALELSREERRTRKDTDLETDAEVPGDEDETKAFVEGVEIRVSLPRKKIRGLEMLSGGERALTSIALIFAMSQVNPPPFIILDETDAALDEANSRRYGDMIENLAARTQLILITHNRETMSRAGVLYGVTMGTDAASQLLSISFTEAVAVAK